MKHTCVPVPKCVSRHNMPTGEKKDATGCSRCIARTLRPNHASAHTNPLQGRRNQPAARTTQKPTPPPRPETCALCGQAHGREKSRRPLPERERGGKHSTPRPALSPHRWRLADTVHKHKPRPLGCPLGPLWPRNRAAHARAREAHNRRRAEHTPPPLALGLSAWHMRPLEPGR